MIDSSDCKATFDISSRSRSKSFSNRKSEPSLNEFAILMLTTTNKVNIVTRAVDRILNSARGTNVPIVVSISNGKGSESMVQELRGYPIHVIKIPSIVPQYNLDEGSLGLYEEMVNGIKKFRNYFGGSDEMNVCPAMTNLNHIHLLKVTLKNHTFTKEDFSNVNMTMLNQVTLGNSRFNPQLQILSLNKYKGKTRPTDDITDTKERCSSAHYIKHSLRQVLEEFPSAKYFIIVNDQKQFSPNIIQYFRHTSKIFSLDPSVYCVSAHNPLYTSSSHGPPSKLIRVDHFVSGGATLITKTMALEIIDRYEEPQYGYNEKSETKYLDPLDALSDWLSFPRIRKLRGCVIPIVPRVCSLDQRCAISLTDFDMRKLVKYKFSIDLLHEVEKVQSLKYEEMPCRHKMPLKPKNASLSFSAYVKMDSVDDDFTLYLILKCFGIEHKTMQGNFDSVYTLYRNGLPIYILGVPNSRYGPTIVKGSDIFMVEMEKLTAVAMLKILKFKDYQHLANVTIASIPYIVGNQQDAENYHKLNESVNPMQ